MKRYMHASAILATTVLLLIEGCTPARTTQSPAPILPTTIVTSVSVPATDTPQVIATDTLILVTPTLEASATPSPTATSTPLPTNTVCAPPTGWPTYTIQSGENLYRIALRYNLTTEQLQNANCLASASLIYAGQLIHVPYVLPTSAAPVVSAQTVIPPDLKGEIGFNPGGGNIVPICADASPGGSLQITISERLRDMFELCVYGFPMNDQISVELYAPDQHFVASKQFTVSTPYNDSTIVRISLWMPVGMPLGTWTASARSVHAQIEGQPFSISSFGEPAINTEPVGAINPFEKHKCDVYQRGSSLVIRGSNFGSTQTIPVGIYLWTPNVAKDQFNNFRLPLVSVQLASPSNGEFTLPMNIGSSDATGTYWVVPITNLGEDLYKAADVRNDCYKVP